MSYRQPFKGEWPITQRYGEVVPGVTFQGKPHNGIDYGCPEGTPVLASADGKVMFAGLSTTGYGLYVILRHVSGTATLYAHLSDISVKIDQTVKQGQQIGLSGDTGYATGPHLHFEARKSWHDYKSHFDPFTLPLMSVDDSASTGDSSMAEKPQALKGADAFEEGDILEVTAPLGAKGFYNDGFDFYSAYPAGTEFYFTGKTVQHNGFTYMQVAPIQRPVWMAVNDGDCQILDKTVIK